jgi:chemotaxis signal transduction protein
MLDHVTKNTASRSEVLELVLVETGQTFLAVRASGIKRLQRISRGELQKPEQEVHPALWGYLPPTDLPVFDLAQLLELGSIAPGKEYQILIIERDGYRAGFIVGQAQEVLRAGLDELDVLPALVERSRLRPAVWALWRRTKQDLTILVEPTDCLTAEEWQCVLNKGLK